VHGIITAVTASAYLTTTVTLITIILDCHTLAQHKAEAVHKQLVLPAAVRGKAIVFKVFGEAETVALAVQIWLKQKAGYLNGVGADIALGHSAFVAALNGKKNVQTLVLKQKNGGILQILKALELRAMLQNIIKDLAVWVLRGDLDQITLAKEPVLVDGCAIAVMHRCKDLA
jgi:hypothetical protein